MLEKMLTAFVYPLAPRATSAPAAVASQYSALAAAASQY
jgi:hypothetical protein